MRPIAIDRALNFDILEAFVGRGQPGSEPTEALRPFSGLTSAPLDLFIVNIAGRNADLTESAVNKLSRRAPLVKV